MKKIASNSRQQGKDLPGTGGRKKGASAPYFSALGMFLHHTCEGIHLLGSACLCSFFAEWKKRGIVIAAIAAKAITVFLRQYFGSACQPPAGDHTSGIPEGPAITESPARSLRALSGSWDLQATPEKTAALL